MNNRRASRRQSLIYWRVLRLTCLTNSGVRILRLLPDKPPTTTTNTTPDNMLIMICGDVHFRANLSPPEKRTPPPVTFGDSAVFFSNSFDPSFFSIYFHIDYRLSFSETHRYCINALQVSFTES